MTSIARLALVAILPTTSPAQPAPAPEHGDLAAVSCRVAKVVRDLRDSVLLIVEVHNRNASPLEPLVFHVTGKPKGRRKEPMSVRVARTPLPYVNRIGRVTRAGGKQRYFIQVGVWEPPSRFQVAVEKGLFVAGEGIADPPIRVGRLQHATYRGPSGTLPSTTTTVENSLAARVDAIFRAHFTAPRDGDALVTLTLGPEESREWRITDQPGSLAWGELRSYYPGARIDKLELVDWSIRVESDPREAEQLLERAYSSWARASAPDDRIRGQFSYYYAYGGGSAVPAETTSGGDFTFADGAAAVEVAPAANLPAIGSAIAEAFADLHRPSFEQLMKTTRCELVDLDRVALDGPGWDGSKRTGWEVSTITPGGSTTRSDATPMRSLYQVAGDRIIASGTEESPGSTRWQTQSLGSGWVVTARTSHDGLQREQRSYRMLGTVVVPVRYRKTMRGADGRIVLEQEVRLSNLSIVHTAQPIRPIPQGAAADALRAAWSATYRYPDEKVTLSARFTAENPGTDGIWNGARRVRGNLRLHDFTGMRTDRSGWSRVEVDIDGNRSPAAKRDLANAFSDRLLLWCYRDFAGRAAFDVAFAGTTIARTGDRFEITGGTIATVVTNNGLVEELTLANGLVRKIRFGTTAGQRVPVRIRAGDEELRAKWRDVGSGFVIPTEIEMHNVFGKDWGPETLVLRDIKLR